MLGRAALGIPEECGDRDREERGERDPGKAQAPCPCLDHTALQPRVKGTIPGVGAAMVTPLQVLKTFNYRKERSRRVADRDTVTR